MAGKVETICEQQISPIINKLGYEVVEVEYVKKSDGMNLSFYIDKPGGILIEDCETVHRAIEQVLDEINPTGDISYILNVCSLGLDRPIKNQKDFIRNKGKLVDIKLFVPQNKKKVFTGELSAFDDLQVGIIINNELVIFERTKVAQISPVIQF